MVVAVVVVVVVVVVGMGFCLCFTDCIFIPYFFNLLCILISFIPLFI